MLPPESAAISRSGAAMCSLVASLSSLDLADARVRQSMPRPRRRTARSPSAMCSATSSPGTTESSTGSSGTPTAPAVRSPCGDRRGSSGSPPIEIEPATDRPQAEDALVELLLAVAGDAGDADQLARVHSEVDVGAASGSFAVTGDRHASRTSAGTAWCRGRSRRTGGGGTARPTMASTSSSSVNVDGCRPTHDELAAPQDGDAVGDGRVSRSLCVMITTESPSAAQLVDAREERVDLLRREHARRLVEDDEAGAGHEHLEDLDPLALTDRQVAAPARSGRPRGRTVRLPPRSGPSRRGRSKRMPFTSSASAMFSATVKAGTSRRSWNTMPMPAARTRGEPGGTLVPSTSTDRPRRAGRRRRQLHQVALARAVLAEQRVHLADLDGEVDVVVGDARRRSAW